MKKLESLEVWKAARCVSISAYQLTMKRPLERHFRLADQIRGAACSVPANLAEGYGLATRHQMIRCSRIALGSAYELTVHLQIAADVGLVTAQDFDKVRKDCESCIKLLIGFLKGLERNR